MEQKKRFVVGIDGGGTKTAAIIADTEGEKIAQVLGGPSNFQTIGVDKAAKTLFELVQGCCTEAQCGLDNVVAIVAGLTGAGRPADKQRMEDGFRSFASMNGVSFNLVGIESDARIALEGAFKGKAGIILIAGTGSIAFGKDSTGTIHRVGGWGRMIGDEGSGYAIGREGINAVTRHLDGRGKAPLLAQLLGDKLGLADQEKIIASVYRENLDIAAVAPLVMEAAAKKDTTSRKIIASAAKELANHVKALLKRMVLPSKAKTPLAFIGTIASGDNILSRLLKRRITETIPRVKVVFPEASPAEGAVLLALALLHSKGSK